MSSFSQNVGKKQHYNKEAGGDYNPVTPQTVVAVYIKRGGYCLNMLIIRTKYVLSELVKTEERHDIL